MDPKNQLAGLLVVCEGVAGGEEDEDGAPSCSVDEEDVLLAAAEARFETSLPAAACIPDGAVGAVLGCLTREFDILLCAG